MSASLVSTMSSTALLPLSLTDAPLPLPLLTRALSLSGRSASSAVMFTSPHQLSSLPPSSLGALLLLPMGSMGAGNDELVALLSSARRVLSPSALLAVVPMPNTPIAVQQSYANALLLAGFVDAEVSDNTFVVAKNPAWSAGAAVPLKRKTVATAPAPAPTNAKVTLTADDLVDEDALLLEEDRAPPPAVETETTKEGGGGGCGSNPRKACANCSCGRADALARGEVPEKPVVTQEMLDNPQTGGCGSCGLGDAFRCEGCPYRGLPAFKPGEKIVLDV
uniref:Anamorsin homolog n=1 Tax=Pycnococcus provasolii TaxID=41880 RepID=A0A7S2EZV4_9CHLO|mmetsp:Transcript_10428/g.23550  ORF Transcript_10428/g.23550 Transcript_10428/m.23550 type:complete len:278 (+) Transcript_10428:24-857(+)